MRGQFAGVARNCWSSWGVEFGTRDRVVSVSAVAARTHTTKQLRNLIIKQFYDVGAAYMLTELALLALSSRKAEFGSQIRPPCKLRGLTCDV